MTVPSLNAISTFADRVSHENGATYVVVPTLNEAANLARLVETVGSALGGRPYHIIIVDDGSTDGTQDQVRSLANAGHPVDILERGARLGIGSAVRDGMVWCLARGDAACIVTMDADLSHDPWEIPLLVDATRGADLVQGSRFMAGARIESWSRSRRLLSVVANSLVRLVLRTKMREHTSYFRAYSPEAAEAAVRAEGCDSYEWALGSLLAVRKQGFRIEEVPISFRERFGGSSKLTLGAMFRWFRYLLASGLDARGSADFFARLPRFVLVGLTGMLVNNGVLFGLHGVGGLPLLAALVVAIETSLLWNFEWNERWTFRGRANQSGRMRRLASYHVVCALGIAINVGVFSLVTFGLGVNYLVANLVATVAGFVSNIGGSSSWTWSAR